MHIKEQSFMVYLSIENLPTMFSARTRLVVSSSKAMAAGSASLWWFDIKTTL